MSCHLVDGSLPRQPKIRLALVLSWAVICTTVHVQDLADVEGDLQMGRQTVPIYLGQNVTRTSIAFFVVLWSLIVPWIWGVNASVGILSTSLGISLGIHIFFLRQKTSDERSFRIYNVSAMCSKVRLSKNACCRYGLCSCTSWQSQNITPSPLL